MKWNGLLGLLLCVAVAPLAAIAAEPVNYYQPASLRRTVVQPAAHSLRMAAEPTTAFSDNIINAAPTNSGMIGGGGDGSSTLYGGVTGGYGFGGGYGWARDMSGWNTCDYSAPCTSHLWDGYVQRPHRCHTGHFGCGNGGACGLAGGGCSTCGNGCKNRYHQHCRLSGNHCGCVTSPACDPCGSVPGLGCSSPVGVPVAPAADGTIPQAPIPQAEPTGEDADSAAFKMKLPTLRTGKAAIGSGLR